VKRRRTIRLRLTATYGALFLVSGFALLTINYALAHHQLTGSFFISSGKAGVFAVQGEKGSANITGITTAGAPGPYGPTNAPTPEQVISAAQAQSSASLHKLLVDSAIALAVMAVASIWLGWAIAGRALRPLRTITNTAREISASNLHRRLALEGPDDELKQLGTTFDGLLARLEGAFEAQRQFVANASHELRTPLTYERALLEVALSDPDASAASLRATCEKVLAAGEQQERLIEALLTLSRSQRGLERHDPVDLAAVADTAVAAVDTGALGVEADLEPAHTQGDPRLVERLVANVVGNAVRHNVSGGHVTVATRTRGRRAVLTVTNTGPSIPAAELPRLFRPFERMSGDRAGGAGGIGLGLSIVDAIARAHSAGVTARPRPDGGLDVEVDFPALPAPPGRGVPRNQTAPAL
jgi:signal transduction histidine kinase